MLQSTLPSLHGIKQNSPRNPGSTSLPSMSFLVDIVLVWAGVCRADPQVLWCDRRKRCAAVCERRDGRVDMSW